MSQSVRTPKKTSNRAPTNRAPENRVPTNRTEINSASAIRPDAPKQNRIPATNQVGMSRDYEDLLSKIQNDGGHYLVQYGDKSVWIDTKKSEVYLDFDRAKIPGIETASWQINPTMSPPANAKRLQLELWLFETLWQTSVDIDGKVSDSGLFKLTRWPRPLCSNGRSEALRLAAFIQATPASIALLSSKTSYDESMVKRFLHAALLSGQVHQTGTVNPESKERQQRKPVDEAKLGLLKRLRIKLGL